MTIVRVTTFIRDGKDELMGVNESGLKRTTTKDAQLQNKLIAARKKRDGVADKALRLGKKKKLTSGDVQRLSQHKKDLLKYEKEITKLTDEISKNNVHIQRYKEGLTKEQKKQFETMVKTMKVQGISNEEYLKSHSELSKQLNELSFDIKDATKQKEIIEYDVFLSHSNLDKEEFVSELSDKLEGREIKVFEDVKVFKMGQSQTDMMNMGILNSRFVVIFLSPNFIKSGWSDYEFKSFLNREINEKRIIILPIWHNVSYDDVRDYNPFLVDKFALDTKKYTLDEIVDSIYQVVVDSKNGI